MDQQQTDQPLQSQSELINQLNNVVRQLSAGVQSMVNAAPAATTTTSPKFTGVSLTTTPTVVIPTSTSRHGLVMHNPGTTNIYVYATSIATAPTTTNLAGSIVVYPGGTITFPSAAFPNINAGFSAYNLTGASQPFTVVEFF